MQSFIIGLANVTLRTDAMSHRAMSRTPLTIVKLQILSTACWSTRRIWGALSIFKTTLMAMKLAVVTGSVS
jgi:hypothetical protein